jgi:uncharacterized membrane protein
MLIDAIITFLISLSPLGEARVGIPYGVVNDVPIFWSFLIGWIANLLVFPLFFKSISLMNTLLWKYKYYKISAIYLSKKAKSKTKNSIAKYGAWGLLVFVMIPLPITGAYTGTIAAYILKMEYKKSLVATSIGVTISSVIITAMMYFGVNLF